MKLFRVVQSAALLVVLVSPRVAIAQAGGPQMPPMPKPGPEHEILKMDAGTWDASVEFIAEPGAPPMKSKGVEVNTVGCGGLATTTSRRSLGGNA